MKIKAKYPLAHDGQSIPAGATADVPENLARMWIARGQAEDATGSPASAGSARPATPAPKPPPKSPAVP